jgi:hypothetical protein
VGLRLEADAERNVDKRQAGAPKQLLCPLDSPAQDVFVWPNARRDLELGGEMHARQPDRFRQVSQRDVPVKMGVDVFDNPLQPPL